MLVGGYHDAIFQRKETLKGSDLEALLYPGPRQPQSDPEVGESLDRWFNSYERARAGKVDGG